MHKTRRLSNETAKKMQNCAEKLQHNQSRTGAVPATIASSMCAGSRCAGSRCAGSRCAGSRCAGSRCAGSRCAGSRCAGSRCAGSRCAYWQSSGSHCSVCRFINIVLLALVTSVTCLPPSTPPVKF